MKEILVEHREAMGNLEKMAERTLKLNNGKSDIFIILNNDPSTNAEAIIEV